MQPQQRIKEDPQVLAAQIQAANRGSAPANQAGYGSWPAVTLRLLDGEAARRNLQHQAHVAALAEEEARIAAVHAAFDRQVRESLERQGLKTKS